MERYKVCPYCGRHNLPKMLECVQCETDLTNVQVVDEEIESRKIERRKTTIQPMTKRMIRLCDCGCHNAVNARKCANCGEDISDIVPMEEAEKASQSMSCVLASLDGEYVFEMTDENVNIGRESGMSEYLASKPYVSRQHAELIVENDRFYIQNKSRTNYTYVNNQKIPQEIYELHDGDEIGLGGNSVNGSRQQDAAYFQVRISSCI